MEGRRACRAAPGRASRAQLREEGVALQLDAERRLGPVAGVDRGLRWKAIGERPHRVEERVPVRPRQVDATDRPGKEEIAAEEAAVRVEGEVCRRVAGDRDAFEGDACEPDCPTALEQVV